MSIEKWENELVDIRDFPDDVLDPHESVLANSVNVANYVLTKKIEKGQRVLEIGCGSKSFLLDHLPVGAVWDGIDIFDVDDRGRKSIVTRMGSVHSIPFENEQFEWVLANQSMEHWFEFGVGLSESLYEIGRVLKVGGHALLNFPFHLHGHPYFVVGDLEAILANVDSECWSIDSITAFRDSENPEYQGWLRCGFPNWYVERNGSVSTSFVVELDLRKVSAEKDCHPENPALRPLVLQPRMSQIRRAFAHGVSVLAYKAFRKVLCGRSGY